MTRQSGNNQSVDARAVRMDCLKAVLDFERNLANQKKLPHVDDLPQSRFRVKIEVIAAILISLGIAGASLLGNFLVFNKILHWTF